MHKFEFVTLLKQIQAQNIPKQTEESAFVKPAFYSTS